MNKDSKITRCQHKRFRKINNFSSERRFHDKLHLRLLAQGCYIPVFGSLFQMCRSTSCSSSSRIHEQDLQEKRKTIIVSVPIYIPLKSMSCDHLCSGKEMFSIDRRKVVLHCCQGRLSSLEFICFVTMLYMIYVVKHITFSFSLFTGIATVSRFT